MCIRDRFMTLLHGNGLYALFAGTLFTGIVQSSGASLAIYLSLAKDNLLTTRAGIGLTLGANVGTCLTAVLAALGEGPGPMQVAMSMVLVRSVAAFCFALDPMILKMLVTSLGMCTRPAVVGPHRDEPWQDGECVIAASHTAFNVIIAIMVVPFSGPYARLVKRVVGMMGYRDNKLLGSKAEPGLPV
eukprot:TRINITY_DN4855_c0_g1_i2.p1 TRINITY_DN4855_c0_g1~~TRINITY_DN4855_c0_g1_i2.p1  ORF type:complete len:187 (-),score=29.36 TRINITY_DN4855_c0_g1_i2:91-651(-)